MTGSTATGLFAGLFDDAALFPPGDAPMALAVPAHRELVARWGELVGPFVVPAVRVAELCEWLGDTDRLPVSLIAGAGDLAAAVQGVAIEPRLRLAAVELPVVPDAGAAVHAVQTLHDVLPDSATAAVELPRTAARDEVLDALRGTPYRAKLRTGGVRAELFPSPAELADTLDACIARGVAFKCTAGLHHAVRSTDPATGIEHHGFLNLLLAVEALADNRSAGAAAVWLCETDPAVVAEAVRRRSDGLARARALFTSFGTCSVQEPIDDLVVLDLLPRPERDSA